MIRISNPRRASITILISTILIGVILVGVLPGTQKVSDMDYEIWSITGTSYARIWHRDIAVVREEVFVTLRAENPDPEKVNKLLMELKTGRYRYVDTHPLIEGLEDLRKQRR